MDNPRLCSIVLNLQQRLSDNDRERLDLYLKNDIPKPVGDDSTLSKTLKLIQSLFDQDKTNEKDFALLIDAFKQIQCFDAVNLLEGFFLFLNFI
jgi:transcriptional antiterminator